MWRYLNPRNHEFVKFAADSLKRTEAMHIPGVDDETVAVVRVILLRDTHRMRSHFQVFR